MGRICCLLIRRGSKILSAADVLRNNHDRSSHGHFHRCLTDDCSRLGELWENFVYAVPRQGRDLYVGER